MTEALPYLVEAVVIGGSAGALDVLGQVLPSLPATLAVPVIVVLHLPPRRASLLPELFGPRCALPVREPHDKQPIEPGIWFAPPDYHLMVEADRSFALSIDEPVRFSRPSIDVLFESAAQAYGPRLMGVVLSGANEDGALGGAAIRRLGGFLVVQDPETAQSSEMPQAALLRAAPQRVVTVPEIPTMMVMASGGTP
jgi:two-component system chemotaxis response regulator CheB